MALADGISFQAASAGAGPFSFGAARPSFATLAQGVSAGELIDGQTVSYLAQDSLSAPTQREWGHGTFSAAGSGSIIRTSPFVSVNGTIIATGVPFNFPAAPFVSLTFLAEDLPSTPTVPVGANPTAIAGPVAINGSAGTFMRSDAAPAIQKASSSQFGIVEVDGTTITASGGVISSTGGTSGANPTATAGPVAVNGSASTFMRSDAAPAVQLGTNVQKGIVQVNNTTITASAGVISAVQQSLPTGANPTATAGPVAVNGSASTFMTSDSAPAVQKASASQFGIVEVDGTTITAIGGVISSTGGTSGANPTATAGPVAVNGSASTFLRSDGAPAVQLGTAAQKGIVQVDGTTITAIAGVISAVVPAAANPTATAGPVAVNGSAPTFMRLYGAPAVQLGTNAQKGIVQVNNTTITASAGVISAVQQTLPVGANPTATAGPVAVNGVATTFLRSDGAPAIQKASNSQFGIVEVDGTTITAASGVISSVGASAANPTATAGPNAVNGVATTFMRSDAAPAIQLATAAQFGIVEVDNTTITAAAGVISAVQSAGANPTATAGPAAVNGVATTFMRSDGAPAVQLGTSGQKGIVQVDGTTITASAGVISAVVPAGANPTATAGPAAVNGSATTFMRSDGAPAVQLGTNAQKGIVQVDGTTVTASGGVISVANGVGSVIFWGVF